MIELSILLIVLGLLFILASKFLFKLKIKSKSESGEEDPEESEEIALLAEAGKSIIRSIGVLLIISSVIILFLGGGF